MTPFEEQLKQALQKQEPSGDFTARVLARCAEADAKAPAGFWPRIFGGQSWRLAAAAAALMVMLGGGVAYQQHEREARGQEAKRKLLLAMRIASEKLNSVQRRVVASEENEQ